MIPYLALQDVLRGEGERPARDGDVVCFDVVTDEVLADGDVLPAIINGVRAKIVDEARCEPEDVRVWSLTSGELRETWLQHEQWDKTDPSTVRLGAVVGFWRRPR